MSRRTPLLGIFLFCLVCGLAFAQNPPTENPNVLTIERVRSVLTQLGPPEAGAKAAYERQKAVEKIVKTIKGKRIVNWRVWPINVSRSDKKAPGNQGKKAIYIMMLRATTDEEGSPQIEILAEVSENDAKTALAATKTGGLALSGTIEDALVGKSPRLTLNNCSLSPFKEKR